MAKHKVTRAEWRRAEKQARKLLQSPRFFNEFLLAIEREGLVGEKQTRLCFSLWRHQEFFPARSTSSSEDTVPLARIGS
jgi:hypothetical protein